MELLFWVDTCIVSLVIVEFPFLQKSSDDDEMDFNMKSKESSKEDDIQAICELRGAGRNAPLALQLKAIDEEYHYLLDQGQSDRADNVQKLYAWKSKQATQVY